MKKTSIVIAMLFLIACGTTKKMATEKPADSITENDATRAAQKFPGTTLADLHQGKTFYEQNCVRCHALIKPESKTEEKWRHIVPPMAKKARIDNQTEDLILKYVVTMSTAQKNG